MTLKDKLLSIEGRKVTVRKDGTVNDNKVGDTLYAYYLNTSLLPAVYSLLIDNQFPVLDKEIELIHAIHNIPEQEGIDKYYKLHIIHAIIMETYFGGIDYSFCPSIITYLKTKDMITWNLKVWQRNHNEIRNYLFVLDTYPFYDELRKLKQTDAIKKLYIPYRLNQKKIKQ